MFCFHGNRVTSRIHGPSSGEAPPAGDHGDQEGEGEERGERRLRQQEERGEALSLLFPLLSPPLCLSLSLSITSPPSQDTKRSKSNPPKKTDTHGKKDKDQKQEKPVSNGIQSSVPVQEHTEAGPTCTFKPVFLPNTSQPCQCSACVGAMAATITKVRGQRSRSNTCGSEVRVRGQRSLAMYGLYCRRAHDL